MECRITATVEVWGSTPYGTYVTTNKLIDAYPLGVIGVQGWFYYVPDEMLADNPVSLNISCISISLIAFSC